MFYYKYLFLANPLPTLPAFFSKLQSPAKISETNRFNIFLSPQSTYNFRLPEAHPLDKLRIPM